MRSSATKSPKFMINCPLCQSKNIFDCMAVKDMHILKCADCGMMFQLTGDKPIEPGHDANDYLPKDMTQEYLAAKKAIELNDRIRNLQRFAGDLKGKKVLEIGSGLGILGGILAGLGANYTGTERSKSIFDAAIKNDPNLEGKLLNLGPDGLDFPESHFDVIIMIDTLEHIPDAISCLRRLRKLLRPGGLIYIEVPNESMLKVKGWLRIKANIYNGYPTHRCHYNLFAKATISRILRDSGFRILSISQSSVYGNIHRMQIAFNMHVPFWMPFICRTFRFTKIDLLMRQGNFLGVASKDEK